MSVRRSWLASLAWLVPLTALVATTSVASAQPRQREDGASKDDGKDDGKDGSEGNTPAHESIDWVVARWHSKATGGARKPQLITARQLAFEARLEALTTDAELDTPYQDKHVRAAIQRRVTETMLAVLPVEPAMGEELEKRYTRAARVILLRRIDEDVDRAHETLKAAQTAEGISDDEVEVVLRRRARASWYLDQTVAPMLQPTELDLREAHSSGETPFTEDRYEDVVPQLRQWYISTRLAGHLDAYYRSVRSRVKLKLIGRPPKAPRDKPVVEDEPKRRPNRPGRRPARRRR